MLRTKMPNTPAYWSDLMLANAAFKSYNVSFVHLWHFGWGEGGYGGVGAPKNALFWIDVMGRITSD